jgi:beta-1,2-mannobiose phosphorylase / 1,2-beta-oligomannan phosphorylase
MIMCHGNSWLRFAIASSSLFIAPFVEFPGVCGIACADDLQISATLFEPADGNPVFVAAEGKWDTKIRERGWILKDESGWKLWYTGYDPAIQPPMMSLGLATSFDGVTWKRSSQTPIFADGWVEDMMVIRHDGTYYMFAEGAEDQSQLLTSADGIHWNRIGTLDIRKTDGQRISPGPFGTPTAYFEDGVWSLFYERRDAGIWLARSTDMKVWTNVSDDPLILPGPDTYDSLMIAMNQIVRVGDQYIAVLHGTGSPEKPRQWCTYLATSRDLIHWTKDPRGPLRPIAENKSSGQLVLDGQQWRLYTMHEKVTLHLPQLKP